MHLPVGGNLNSLHPITPAAIGPSSQCDFSIVDDDLLVLRSDYGTPETRLRMLVMLPIV
jgi:hypothetical protein